MVGLSLECVLVVTYSFALALIAFLLEWVAGHAHKRSIAMSTAGFTYHADRDIWRCPKDQHLFPVFSDSARGKVIYRAPASACNTCPSKAACTDSNQGREIERNLGSVDSGMKRFHRAVSLTLMLLASIVLAVELFRVEGIYPKIILGTILALFCILIQKLLPKVSEGTV
jgi:heme A synthase